MGDGLHFPSKRIPLHSILISIQDVKRIFERLLRHVEEQADREIAALQKPEGQSEEDFDKKKAIIKNEAFRITVTIRGKSGEAIFGDSAEIFKSPNIPEEISSIFMTNIVAYEGFANEKPINSFDLQIDFSKPPLLDSKNWVSAPTTNLSELNISGERESWVASIEDAVIGVLRNRKTRRSLIHQAFVYDFGLFIIGVPFALYICWRLSGYVEAYLGSINHFLSAAAYVYLFFVVLWIYRILFGYTKWAFPTVELVESKNVARRHRAFWYVIVVGILGNAIWDVFA